MSLLRDLYREFCAVLKTATVCALVFGLIFSSVAQASGGSASHGDIRIGAYARCLQHLTHRAAASDGAAASDRLVAPANKGKNPDQGHCPDCCLTGHAAAVLPERFASFARPIVDRATPAYRIPAAAWIPTSYPPSAGNGARAPPSLI